MKQKFIFVLSLVAMAMSSAVNAAERVAPTLPESQTPTSGNSYWIYNVGTGLFLGNFISNYAQLSAEGIEMYLTATDKGYTIRRESATGYYFGDNGNSTYYSDAFSSYHEKWTISATTGGYKIQRYNESNYYNPDEYLGYTENNDKRVYSNMTVENVIWKFIDYSQAAHYAAEVRLYQALENTNGTTLETLDWFLNQYETLYTNRASSTTEELTAAARKLNGEVSAFNNYQAPEWNEFPVILTSSDGFSNDYRNGWASGVDNNASYGSFPYMRRDVNANSTSTLSATVCVDQPSTFIYSLAKDQGNRWFIDVYVDDVLMRSFTNWNLHRHSFCYAGGGHDRFFEVLSTGTHTIKWVCKNTDNNYSTDFNIYDISCVATPLIEVNLLEPGSLGTEVLYQTNHIKNVKRLKISGEMNADDWAKIKMMTSLFELDMKNAITDAVPYKQFWGNNSQSAKKFMHKIVLPDVLQSIGDLAFEYSYVEEVVFPDKDVAIGERAFRQTHLKNIVLPDDFTSLGNEAFSDNDQCITIDLGKSIKRIAPLAFTNNRMVQTLTMPNTVQEIGHHAFSSNYPMQLTTEYLPSSLITIDYCAFQACNLLNVKFPESLKSIGSEAFDYGYAFESIVLPQNVTSIGSGAFKCCTNLVNVELPVGYYSINDVNIFNGCSSLSCIRLNSPTVVQHPSSFGIDLANVTLEVPSYLVNSYKLDEYWYDAEAIEGFSTADIQDWVIQTPLVLNAHDRFEGNPNITIQTSIDRLPSLKINGDAAQEINNLSFYSSQRNYVNYPGQILCNGDNVTINGTVMAELDTNDKRWYFFSLPFDMKVSDINTNGAQYAIRYYDGSNRATNGPTGSWKNYDEDDVIPAGTGFIFQTNINARTEFYSQNNANKQNVVKNSEFTKTLEVNASETASNKGWNLIGNPYQCYYNNHMLNFTAPITVWDAWNRTYTAYSLTDDDYAIRPNEAFFVQCPNEQLNTISFPLQGRQLTATIESQNAGKMRRVQAVEQRQLIDLEVRNGEVADKTRVVMNEEASLGYDMDCDASKFMSAEAPQIYTIGDDGTAYAINERPSGEGEVQLGFYAEKQGAFTISMSRCQAQKVYLVDTFENLTVDLTEQDYGFTAAAGKQEARFRLVIDAGETTAIKDVKSESVEESEDGSIYNLNGQRVGDDYKGIAIKDGKKVYIK